MMVKIFGFLLFACLWSVYSYADHVHTEGVKNGFTPVAFFVPGKSASYDTLKKYNPKEIITSTGIEFVLVPDGEFLMGSKVGDADEQPMRKKRIRQDFYISKYEITQSQWHKVMGTRPWKGRGNVKVGDKYPAVYVSWLEVKDFVSRANKQEGCTCFRLPTEVEWEYTARAGTFSSYSFGNDPGRLGEVAWYSSNAVKQQFAHAVGQKHPNPWGIYDMHGNVWEWVADWHDEDLGPRIRGGSWGSPASSLRSANRSAAHAESQTSHIGFRLVRTLD